MLLWVASALAEPHLHASGLRSNIIPDPTSPTVDVATAIAVGEVDDPVGAEGTAHGVEHAWFTQAWKGGSVLGALEGLGCASNAFTGHEWMLFVQSCPAAALDEVLALTRQQFEPWRFGDDEAREWRVIGEEELGRGDRPEIVEEDFVTRQLLPASHPVRLRAARPRISPYPGAAALTRFVEDHFRRDRTAVVVAGPVDAAAVQAVLDREFGPSSPRNELPPVGVVPPPRNVLRVAPRTVPGIAASPQVVLGWSQPELGGLIGVELDLYIEAALRYVLRDETRLLDLECHHLDVRFTRTFRCALEVVDDAAATAIGETIHDVLPEMEATRLGGVYAQVVTTQVGLWNLRLRERHVAELGSPAGWGAYDLLDGMGEATEPDLKAWMNNANLPGTALVLILPGGAAPRVDSVRPGAVSERPATGTPAIPPPAPPPALHVLRKVLDSGLELLAVQRPDARLVHVAMEATAPATATARSGILGRDDARWTYAGTLNLQESASASLFRSVATAPSLAAELAHPFAGEVDHVHFSLASQTRHRRARTLALAAWRSGPWAQVLTARSLRPATFFDDPGPLSTEALRAAAGALFVPSRTRVVVVGPGDPASLLEPFSDPRWGAWRPAAGAATPLQNAASPTTPARSPPETRRGSPCAVESRRGWSARWRPRWSATDSTKRSAARAPRPTSRLPAPKLENSWRARRWSRSTPPMPPRGYVRGLAPSNPQNARWPSPGCWALDTQAAGRPRTSPNRSPPACSRRRTSRVGSNRRRRPPMPPSPPRSRRAPRIRRSRWWARKTPRSPPIPSSSTSPRSRPCSGRTDRRAAAPLFSQIPVTPASAAPLFRSSTLAQSESTMILVFSPTGTTGRALLTTLSGRPNVRAFVRDPARLPPGVQAAVGDFDDPAAVRAALRGVRAVYLATPGGPTQEQRQCSIIDAAAAAGVSHIVKLSGLGASADAPVTVASQHGRIEAHLARSGVPATVLRPNFFMQNLLNMAPALRGGVLPAPAGEGAISFVDARDVAEVAAWALTAPTPPRASLDLCGGEALTHSALAARLGEGVGRSIRYVDLPVEAWKDGARAAGMDAWHIEAFAQLYERVVKPGWMATTPGDLARVLGRPPRTVDGFVADHRAAL